MILKQMVSTIIIGDSEGVIITCIGNLDLNNKVMILVIADTDERLDKILNIATYFK